jgi:malic enzyme
LRALQQQAGLSQAAARRRIWLVDSQGLITADRARAGLSPQKAAFARAAADLVSPAPEWTGGGSNGSSSSSSGGSSGGGGSSSRQLHEQLAGLVAATRATALIGAAAVPGAFGQPVIEALVKVCVRVCVCVCVA